MILPSTRTHGPARRLAHPAGGGGGGPAPAPPPPMRPAPSPSGPCSDEGENCQDTRCCNDPSQGCYVKSQYWAGCRAAPCTPGVFEYDPPEHQDPWSCEELGPPLGGGGGRAPPGPPSRPAPAPPPPAAPTGPCSDEGENCQETQCCNDPSQGCYEK